MSDYKTILDRKTGELKKVPLGYKEPEKAITSELPEIDVSDKEKLKTLAYERLIEIIRISPPTLALIPAIRELLDRVEGKPGQQVTIDQNVNVITVNASISFAGVQPAIEHGTTNSRIIDNTGS